MQLVPAQRAPRIADCVPCNLQQISIILQPVIQHGFQTGAQCDHPRVELRGQLTPATESSLTLKQQHRASSWLSDAAAFCLTCLTDSFKSRTSFDRSTARFMITNEMRVKWNSVRKKLTRKVCRETPTRDHMLRYSRLLMELNAANDMISYERTRNR